MGCRPKNPSHADLNNKRFEGTGEFRCKEALDFPAFSQKRKMFSGPSQRGYPANLPGDVGRARNLNLNREDYFNLSEKDTRIATAQRERKAPTLEQVRHVIGSMPAVSEIEKRDRALVAFTLLSGARDSAIASMKLKHVELKEGCVQQDAREVNTKFSRTFTTYFFPVGDEIRQIVEDWVECLRKEKLWGNDDPLFPATRVALGANRQFEAAGLERRHWSTATPIRAIFREAFKRAGLPYFHPHSLRKTLARLGEQFCQSAEEFKAWSQNLGHEQVLTTFMSYGKVATERQGEIIRGIGAPKPPVLPAAKDIAEAVLRRMQNARMGLPVAQ